MRRLSTRKDRPVSGGAPADIAFFMGIFVVVSGRPFLRSRPGGNGWLHGARDSDGLQGRRERGRLACGRRGGL